MVYKLAGRSGVRLTTQTYAHVQVEALRSAVGVLDRVGLVEGEVSITGGSTGSRIIAVILTFLPSGGGIFFDMPTSSIDLS